MELREAKFNTGDTVYLRSTLGEPKRLCLLIQDRHRSDGGNWVYLCKITDTRSGNNGASCYVTDEEGLTKFPDPEPSIMELSHDFTAKAFIEEFLWHACMKGGNADNSFRRPLYIHENDIIAHDNGHDVDPKGIKPRVKLYWKGRELGEFYCMPHHNQLYSGVYHCIRTSQNVKAFCSDEIMRVSVAYAGYQQRGSLVAVFEEYFPNEL